MRSNFAAVLVILAKEATVTDGKDARPAPTEEEPERRSIAAPRDQQPAHTASRVAQDAEAASMSKSLAALIRTAAGGSEVAAAAQSMASRCGLDAAEGRPVAAVVAALLVFKLLGLLCSSELVAGMTVVFAAFLYFAQQPQRQPAQVSLARCSLTWASLVRAPIVSPLHITSRSKPLLSGSCSQRLKIYFGCT